VTKAWQDENGNRAKGKNEDRDKDRDKDRGKDIEIPNIYSSKMNK
jgi:hypothetical protein